ncbi:MAG: epoxyqueuosine reductase, partial [Actinomycetota bacterium]|nr:epoxyqueuosine reductase [Actinomycetota bacterium]
VVSLVEWLEASDDALGRRYDRLYYPRNDPRFLRRNALVAAGNSMQADLADAVGRYAEDPDPLLREHAEWALSRLVEHAAAR